MQPNVISMMQVEYQLRRVSTVKVRVLMGRNGTLKIGKGMCEEILVKLETLSP